jgi:hypothetical protein
MIRSPPYLSMNGLRRGERFVWSVGGSQRRARRPLLRILVVLKVPKFSTDICLGVAPPDSEMQFNVPNPGSEI